MQLPSCCCLCTCPAAQPCCLLTPAQNLCCANAAAELLLLLVYLPLNPDSQGPLHAPVVAFPERGVEPCHILGGDTGGRSGAGALLSRLSRPRTA